MDAASRAIYITIFLVCGIFFSLIVASLILTIRYYRKITKVLNTMLLTKEFRNYAELSQKYQKVNKELTELKQKLKKLNS